jgi:hypothetical protein
MPLPAWPSTVPFKPRRTEWSMPQPFLPPLATEMDGGNTRLRSRPGDNVAIVQQIIRMSVSEFNTFDAFVRGTLNNGTSRFTGNVWLGSAYANKTLQFAEPPQPQAAGQKIPVAMKIRVYGM